MITKELFGKDEGADELLGKIVALYVGKSNCNIFGKAGYISDDRRIRVIEINGCPYAPSGFVEKCFSAPPSNVNPIVNDGIAYTSISEVCSRLGLCIHYEANGLCIISRDNLDSVLDWVKNTRLMRNIPESFVFDDATAEELLALIKKRYGNEAHPRLIFTKKKTLRIRREIQQPNGDRVYKALFSKIIGFAERFLNEEPSKHELRDGIRLGYVCQENARRMLILALAYNLTDDERYARRAYREMLYSSSFPDFNPYHFLDVGEMCLGLGLAYDWLYGYMSEDERTPIREAIVEKGIYPINEDFDNLPRHRSWNWREELADNWRLVISGVGVGALAILDELEGEALEKSKRAAEQTLYDTRRALSLFAPYGAYEEGHAYWYFGMKYFCYLMASLISSVGTDFGYTDAVGMKMTNKYLMAMNGPVSTFDYHDCDPKGSNIPPETMFLADFFGKPEEALPRINKILTEDEDEPYKLISDMYGYNPDTMSRLSDNQSNTPCDICLPVAEVSSMRTGFGKNDMWLGFHCDDPIGGEGHDHMDSGSFVLDALGESFFFDLGRDDYNLPNYLNCYRVRDEGHNTVIFNPDEGYSMAWGGRARIEQFTPSDRFSYSIGNLTEAYREDFGIKSYRRGAGLLKNKHTALVQDEIRLTKAAELYWFAHTDAEITLSEDSRSAVLTKNGKSLYGKIISDNAAVFSVMEAVPLASSPIIPGQMKNEGIKKLTVHLREALSLDLCIAFTENRDYAPDFTPLDKWNNLI